MDARGIESGVKDSAVSARVSTEHKNLIVRAADITGRTEAGFIRLVLVNEARRIVEEAQKSSQKNTHV